MAEHYLYFTSSLVTANNPRSTDIAIEAWSGFWTDR